jgi:hypothetical protein
MDDILNIDISIKHSTSATMSGKASRTAGAAADARDKAEISGHARNSTPGYSPVPFSIETYGRLTKESDKLLKKLADGAASAGACDRNSYSCWIKINVKYR